MKPELSIVVPIFNVSAYLHECVNSILSQTFTDFELILVDDGSTDGSSDICDKFAQSDSRVRVIHKENGGVVSARKVGIQAAVGKYAGYVDGDDWIDPLMYEKMIFYIKKHDCDMVMCDVEHENKSLPLSSGVTISNISNGYHNRVSLEEKMFPTMIYAGEFYQFGVYPVIWNKLYKREKLIKYQLAVDENINTGEDAACVYPYLLECESIYFLKDISLYHYRQSHNQMTAIYDKSYFGRFKSLYSFLSKSNIATSPYANQLDYYYSYLIKTTISNELKKANGISFREKLRNIKEISAFANNAGYINNMDISSFPLSHSLYFTFLKKNKPLLLVIGITLTRLIQNIFR